MPGPGIPIAAAAAPAAGAGISAGMGSIISTGMSMLGGLFGSKKSQPQYDDKYFQRSVKDAKLAGLHPLFALGGAGAPGPTFMAGQSETGSKLGDALKTASRGVTDYSRATAQNPLTTKLAELQISNMEINVRKNLIDEQLMASELRRTTQDAGATGADREFIPDVKEQMHTKVKQDVVKHPEHQKISIVVPGGKRLIIGPSATAEEIEDIFGDVAGSVYGVAKAAESAYLSIMEEARTKNWGKAGTKQTLDAIKKFVAKLRMDKSYKKITKTTPFRNYADRVAPLKRKRIY